MTLGYAWRQLVCAIAFAYILPVTPMMAQSATAQTERDRPPASAGSSDAGRNVGDVSTSTDQEQAGSNDRLFWTLPNFLTVENSEQAPPMTARQKFNVVKRSAFDPVELGWYGFLTAVNQAEGSEPTYGTNAAGFAKRYALEFSDGTIENFMVGAVLPSVLHQDPRYYQLGQGGIWHRTGYSVSRLAVTRGDSGRIQLNFSEILGSGATAGLSTLYHPAGERSVADALTVWGSQMGYDAIANVVKEFWPDIRRKFHKT